MDKNDSWTKGIVEKYLKSAESIKNEFLNIKGGYYDNFFLTAVGRQGAPLPAKEVSIVVSPKNLALFEYWEEEV